jgi:hypothetical protein
MIRALQAGGGFRNAASTFLFGRRSGRGGVRELARTAGAELSFRDD